MPAGTLGDLFHFARVGRDAEREVRGAEAAPLPGLPDKAAAFLAGGLQFGPGRVDLDPEPWSSSCNAKKLPGLGGNGTALPPMISASTSAECLGSRAAIDR